MTEVGSSVRASVLLSWLVVDVDAFVVCEVDVIAFFVGLNVSLVIFKLVYIVGVASGSVNISVDTPTLTSSCFRSHKF